jgi:hypothetical protein
MPSDYVSVIFERIGTVDLIPRGELREAGELGALPSETAVIIIRKIERLTLSVVCTRQS